MKLKKVQKKHNLKDKRSKERSNIRKVLRKITPEGKSKEERRSGKRGKKEVRFEKGNM